MKESPTGKKRQKLIKQSSNIGVYLNEVGKIAAYHRQTKT